MRLSHRDALSGLCGAQAHTHTFFPSVEALKHPKANDFNKAFLVPDATAANVLRIGDIVYYCSTFPESTRRFKELAQRTSGVRFWGIDNSEFHKVDGALTCCSVIVEID